MSESDKILKFNFILNVIFTVSLAPVWYFFFSGIGSSNAFADPRWLILFTSYVHIIPSIISNACHYTAYKKNTKFIFGGMGIHLLFLSSIAFMILISSHPDGGAPRNLESINYQIMLIMVATTQVVIPFTLLLFAEGPKKAGRLMARAVICAAILVVGTVLALLLFNSNIFDNTLIVGRRGAIPMGKLFSLGVFFLSVITVGFIWEKD